MKLDFAPFYIQYVTFTEQNNEGTANTSKQTLSTSELGVGTHIWIGSSSIYFFRTLVSVKSSDNFHSYILKATWQKDFTRIKLHNSGYTCFTEFATFYTSSSELIFLKG